MSYIKSGSDALLEDVRRQREKDMVGHQAIGPDLRCGPLRRLRQKIAIERIVGIFEKGLRPAIAALGDVIGDAGNNEAGKASCAIWL
ncbi:MAG: hypothetical protein WA793_00880 [Sphingorhabdus sp.]|uniref:hypothetical protein n=1 Tax=Sphingorhabdus sp. TaxID=1902408 RepID=UPI003CA3E82F